MKVENYHIANIYCLIELKNKVSQYIILRQYRLYVADNICRRFEIFFRGPHEVGHKKIKTLESLLKRPNLTIEELLDYDHIIQKARNNDVGLSLFFQNEEHFKWLLDIFLKRDLPLERRIKYK